MKKNFLTSLIVFGLILIFIIWLFDLKSILKEDEIGNSLQINLERAFDEIKDSVKDMTDGIKKLKDEDLPNLLNDEEVLRLKEKVLEYEKEY